MPIYEYECERCGGHFEVKRNFHEDGDNPCCPQCKGKVRRLFFPSAVVFKGSGFYVTDNRGNHSHAADEGKTGKTEKTESGKKSETSKKSEAK